MTIMHVPCVVYFDQKNWGGNTWVSRWSTIKIWEITTCCTYIYTMCCITRSFWLVRTYDLLEDRRMDDITINNFFAPDLYYIKQISSMLPWVCTAIDYRWRQNVVRTSEINSTASCVPLLFVMHFGLICDPLLNRRMVTWNLFVICYLLCRMNLLIET